MGTNASQRPEDSRSRGTAGNHHNATDKSGDCDSTAGHKSRNTEHARNSTSYAGTRDTTTRDTDASNASPGHSATRDTGTCDTEPERNLIKQR